MKKFILFNLFIALFAITSFAQSVPGGDMENWRTHKIGSDTIYNAANWYSYDSIILSFGPLAYSGAVFERQTFQTTDKHSGNYAAMVMTRQQDSIGIAPGSLLNMLPIFNPLTFNPSDPYSSISYSGGTAVTQRIASVSAWIKYLPRGADQGEITIYAVLTDHTGKDSVVVGSADTTLSGAIATYTQITLHPSYMNATVVPNKIEMQFSSSIFPPDGTAVDSSTLYVDDVTMMTTDVPGVSSPGHYFAIYPNPSTGIIQLNGAAGEQLCFRLYDLNGKQVAEKYFTGSQQANYAYLPAGVYLYNVTNKENLLISRGKLSLEK
jgi:hypothetical protein